MAQAHLQCSDLHGEGEKKQKVLYKHQREFHHKPAVSSECSGRSIRNAESWERCFSRLQLLSLQFRGSLSKRLDTIHCTWPREGLDEHPPVLMWLNRRAGKSKRLLSARIHKQGLHKGLDNARDSQNLNHAVWNLLATPDIPSHTSYLLTQLSFAAAPSPPLPQEEIAKSVKSWIHLHYHSGLCK